LEKKPCKNCGAPLALALNDFCPLCHLPVFTFHKSGRLSPELTSERALHHEVCLIVARREEEERRQAATRLGTKETSGCAPRLLIIIPLTRVAVIDVLVVP
jgi:hypothetical protein